MAHQEQSSPGKACGRTGGKAKINMLATATAKTTSKELEPESTTRANMNKEENPSKVTGSFLCKEKEVQLQYQLYEENEIIWNLFDTTSDDDNEDETRNITRGDHDRTRQHPPGITGQNDCVGTS